MHLEESPTALQTSVIANTNRDPKKKKDAYKIDDFYIFQMKEDMQIPMARFGAAAMELVKLKELPPWALFVFKDLQAAAEGSPPVVLSVACSDAIILGPILANGRVKGMIVCLESAYGQRREMTSRCGLTAVVDIPNYKGKVYADDEFSATLH